jgi:hypothetical protein
MKRLTAAVALLTAVAVAATPRRRRRRRSRPPDGTVKPPPSGPEEVGGMASDRVVVEPGDDPPSADEYDNEPPCLTIPSTDSEGNESGISGYATRYPFAGWEAGGSCTPPWDLEPEQRTSAPFAAVRAEADKDAAPPLWPVDTERESKVRVSYRDVRGKWHGAWGRHVGSTRRGDDGSRRHHAGVDLFADQGDVVLAMEDGEVIAMLPFHHGTWAVYVRNKDGQIVNYGELGKHSWMEFGFPMQVIEGETETVQVTAGQPIGRVGLQSGGDTMVHFEMFAPEITVADIRAQRMSWPWGQSAPPGLLDPSRYLVVAQKTWYDQQAEIT